MSEISNLRAAYEFKPATVVAAIENSEVSFGRFGRRKVTIKFGEEDKVEVTIRQLRKLVKEKVSDHKLSSAVKKLEEALSTKDRSELPVITRQVVKLKDKISKLASKIKPRREEPVEAPKNPEVEKREDTAGLALGLTALLFKPLKEAGISANLVTTFVTQSALGLGEKEEVKITHALENLEDKAAVKAALEAVIDKVKGQEGLKKLKNNLEFIQQKISE